MLHSNAFFLLLDKPTLITDSSSSSFDHKLANSTNSVITTGIINFEIPDHFPIFVYIANAKKHHLLKRNFIDA